MLSTNFDSPYSRATEYAGLTTTAQLIEVLRRAETIADFWNLAVGSNSAFGIDSTWDAVIEQCDCLTDYSFNPASGLMTFSGKTERFYKSAGDPQVVFHVQDYSKQRKRGEMYVHPIAIVHHLVWQKYDIDDAYRIEGEKKLRDLFVEWLLWCEKKKHSIHFSACW